MKTFSSTLKKGSATLLLLAGLFSMTTYAQGHRNRQFDNNSRRDGGGTRNSTFRDRPSRQFDMANHNSPRPDRQFNNQNNPRPNRIESNNNGVREQNRERFNNRNFPSVRNNDNNRRFNPTPRVDNNNSNRSFNRPGNNSNFNNRRNDYSRNGRPFPGNYYNNRYRRPVYSPRNPSWRYSYMPRRHSVWNTLPSSFLTINFGGYGYRYCDGVFYRPYNNVFTVIAPPIGIRINVLPAGYRRIYVHDYPYYYYNGTYYDQRDNEYVVVSPPVGAIVESIPEGYETVTVDGETYYVVDGAQYKPVVQDNGEIWYEVIKAN